MNFGLGFYPSNLPNQLPLGLHRCNQSLHESNGEDLAAHPVAGLLVALAFPGGRMVEAQRAVIAHLVAGAQGADGAGDGAQTDSDSGTSAQMAPYEHKLKSRRRIQQRGR